MTAPTTGQERSRTRAARAEAMRVAPEVLERRRHGETMVAVFDDLIERDEITMAYRTFAQWMKRFADDPSLLPDEKADRGKGSGAQDARARKTSVPVKDRRDDGGTRHVSMDFMAGAFKPKPPGHKPDMKKLIGPDYEEEY